MQWHEEWFVKLYTRDTADWLALSWKAQGLFCLLLRKVGRSGELSLGKHGRRGISSYIGGAAAWAEIEPVLTELIADGCVQLDEGEKNLIIPNFQQAQETSQSPALRKQKQRMRDAPVTKSHEVSPGITDTSAPVTKSHEVSLREESRREEKRVDKTRRDGESPHPLLEERPAQVIGADRALDTLLLAAGAFFHGEKSGTSPIKLGKKGLGMSGLQMGEQERQWCEAWKSAGQSYGLEDLRRLGEAIKSKAVYKARPPSIGEVCRKLPDLLAEALAWNGGTADTEVEEYPYKPFDTEAARRRYLGQE